MSNIQKVVQFTKFGSRSFTNQNKNHLHVSASRQLPQAERIRLPDNVQDINASEMGQFSPQRTRDINGPVIVSHKIQNYQVQPTVIDITVNSDPHVASYDCNGAVSLSSSMQSNVPSPFSGNRTHLGMPGSQWGQAEKYLSDHLRNSHYLNLRNTYRNYNSGRNTQGIHTLRCWKYMSVNGMKTMSSIKPHNKTTLVVDFFQFRKINEQSKPLTMQQKLKKTITEYGTTVIVFHVAISLVSLGLCYTLVSSGLDLVTFLEYLHLADESTVQRLGNAGTFVVAYGVHKVFAPARIGTTLIVAPVLVKYLRKKGILKS